MFKNLTYSFVFVLLVAAIVGCGGKEKTDAGIAYTFHVKNEGKKAQNGDVITAQMLIHAKTKAGKDTTLTDTYKMGQPFVARYEVAPTINPIIKSFGILSEGDSVTFFVPIDTLVKGSAGVPPFLEAGSETRIIMKVLKIQNGEDYSKEMQAKMMEQQAEMQKKQEAQIPIDEETIKKYVADNKLNATRSQSGLYYAISSPGTGEKPKEGETVTVHYTGYLIDGKKFDSSFDRGQPADFPFQQGATVQGFYEGLSLLKKGGKATIIMPSHLGYGGGGQPQAGIAPFSILRFEVELVDIKAGSPVPQQ
jgi:FKBP-type peptidyl-prolyl cis-trans isomerase FkpA